MEEIILAGFGGHAKSVIDSIEQKQRFRIIGFTDVKPVDSYRGYPYLGTDAVLEQYYRKGIRNAFISVGYLGRGKVRDNLYKQIKSIGYNLPVIIDATAIIANDVKIGEGTFVGKRAVVNSSSEIGKMCIINTGAVIEHDNRIGDFSHVAVKGTLCGSVKLADHCMVGANATIIQNISVGAETLIGAGSVVYRDVSARMKIIGSSKYIFERQDADYKV